MAKKNQKSKDKSPTNPPEDQYFSKRTISDMFYKGIGHSGLKKVLDNFNKRR